MTINTIIFSIMISILIYRVAGTDSKTVKIIAKIANPKKIQILRRVERVLEKTLSRVRASMDEAGQPQVCTKGSKSDLQGNNMEENSKNMDEDSRTEEIHKQLESLSLEEIEKRRVVEIEEDDIEETNKDFSNSVTCKILFERVINKEVFMDMIPRIWRVEGKVMIKKAGRNIYLCKFRNIRNMNRISKGGPWSFDDALLLFDEPKGNCNIIAFRYVSFWIHFHNLPRVCFCRKYAEVLGNAISIIERADTDEYGKMEGETLRLKIIIDVNEPIKRGTYMKIGSKEEMVWILITFEKFPDFCYYCGMLGHVMQDCDEEGVEEAGKHKLRS